MGRKRGGKILIHMRHHSHSVSVEIHVGGIEICDKSMWSDDRDGGKWCETFLKLLYTRKVIDSEGQKFKKTWFSIEIGPRSKTSKISLERSTQKNEICRSLVTEFVKSLWNDRFQFGQIFNKNWIVSIFPGPYMQNRQCHICTHVLQSEICTESILLRAIRT